MITVEPVADAMGRRVLAERGVDEYWDWFAASLFLLIPLDMLTTVGVEAIRGLAAEINPLTVWLFRRGLVALAAANLLAVVISAGAFAGVMAALQRTPPPHDTYFAYVIEVWLGLLVATGLFIIANNLMFLVHGRSLINLVV
ncbi:MAG: hypothetical protein V5A43_10110 [Haloarculaceae archaeon]